MKHIETLFYSFVCAGFIFLPVWVILHSILPISEDADPAQYSVAVYIVLSVIVYIFFGRQITQTIKDNKRQK